MKGHGSKLGKRMELAVVCLLAESTDEQAAAKAGISLRTLKSWKRLPEFQAILRRARAEVVEGAITRLQQTALKAVTTLYELLSCDSPSVRCRAAQAILDGAVKGVELSDLLARIERLEQSHEQVQHSRSAGSSGAWYGNGRAG